MENNNEITNAIPYVGNEEGIEAIIIARQNKKDITLNPNSQERKTVHDNEIKNIPIGEAKTIENTKDTFSKAKPILIILLILCVAGYFIVQNSLNNNKIKIQQEADAKAIQDSIAAVNAVMQAAEAAAATQAAAEQAQKQSCYFNQLSRLFDYEIKVFPTTDNTISFLELKIIDKSNNNVLKSLNIKTATSLDCNARSYITGFNKDEEVMDNDYGFLIIQDFNFDGLEDIAVKTDMGNSGSHYNFYLQTVNHDYISDSFLTDSVSYFPTLDFEKRTLNLSVRAGASNFWERSYQYDTIAGWKVVSDTLIEITE